MRASRVVAAFAGLALAVIAGVAWLLLRESWTRPSSAQGESAEVEVTIEGGEQAVVRLEIGTPATLLGRPSVRKTARPPPPPEGPTLVVLAAENSRPLPDAEIWLVRCADVTEEVWRALDRFETDLDPIFEASGKRVELDALATAKLEGAHDRAFVFAATPDRAARREIALDGGERIELRLSKREALVIRAVDPDGRRQSEVPVMLQSISIATDPAVAGSVKFLGPTDQHGEARVPWGRELLESHLDRFGLVHEKVVVAALAFPCRDPHATPVDPRRDYRDPVDLETPTRSTLRLRAVDLEGNPLEQGARAVVAFAAPQREEDAEEAPAPRFPVQRTWPVDIPIRGSGELVVEAGCPVAIVARSADGAWACHATILTAPVAEVLELSLRFRPVRHGSDAPDVTPCVVTILDVEGQPLRFEDVLWQIDENRDAGPSANAKRATTDETGRLRCDIPNKAFESSRSLLHVFFEPEQPPEHGARFDGSARLKLRGEAPPFELPVIELRDVPLVIDLKTVDARARPLDRVDVTVETFFDERWSGRTDEDGGFRVRARTRTGRGTLRVAATRSGWWRPNEYDDLDRYCPIEVSHGSAGVTIVLREKGFVDGRLKVEPGIALDTLMLELDPNRPPDVESRLRGDGTFRVMASPSIRDFIVRSQWSDLPAAVVRNVEFREGERTVDPRLDPLDLTDVFRQMELRTVDRSGEAVPGATVWLLSGRNTVIQGLRTTDLFGRALVTTPAFGASLAVTHPDHALRRFALDRADVEIVLDPAFELSLTLSGFERELEQLDVRPKLEHRRRNDSIEEIVHRLGRFSGVRDAQRRFTFKLPIAAEYDVLLHIGIVNEDWWTGRRVVLDEKDGTTAATFEVTARDVECLQRVVARNR